MQMITSVCAAVMVMSSLVPGMTSGVFTSNAPQYDVRGRALCDGLPTVWEKNSRIVNIQDDYEYVSDGQQWSRVAPANPIQGPQAPTTTVRPEPEPAQCPACHTEQTIPEDDYICSGCRTAL